MADDSILDGIKQVKELQELSQQLFQSWSGGGNLGGIFSNLKDKLSGISKELSTASIPRVKELKEEIEEVGKQLKDFAEKSTLMSSLGKAISSVNPEFKSLGAQIAGIGITLALDIKPDAFLALGEGAKKSTGDLTGTYDVLEKFSSKLKVLTMPARLGDSAKAMETSILQAGAASGELGVILNEVGGDMSGLEGKLIKYTKMTYDIGNATGYSSKQVAEYAGMLRQIPGSLDLTISSSDGAIGNIHMLEAAMQVASGTGQNFEEVFKDLNFTYRQFGTIGEEALEYVSRMSIASQNLKMPLEDVKSFTTDAAMAFRFLGNNTQGAISIMEKLGPAMQASGLGPDAIKSLLGSATKSIADFGIAQKAFLSGSSGGRGGMRGAYEIDLSLKEGNIHEVMDKVRESLSKQFGGKIVTLSEAAKDDKAAAQFTKQVQMITTGPTKIAGNQQEAYALLEAFAKGERGQVTPEISKQEDAFKKALSVGDKLQERQFNQLVAINNELQLVSQYSSISAYNMTRLLLGTKGGGANSIDILESMKEASAAAASLGRRKPSTEGGEETTAGLTIGEIAEDAPAKAMEALNRLVGRAKNMAGDAVEGTSELLGPGSAAPPQPPPEATGPQKLPDFLTPWDNEPKKKEKEMVQKAIESASPPVARLPEIDEPEAGGVSQGARSSAQAQAPRNQTQEVKIAVVCGDCNTKIFERVIGDHTDNERRRNSNITNYG